MIKDSSKLKKGQILEVEINRVIDRLPSKMIKAIKDNPKGRLVGYKMVDGNQFGLALEFDNQATIWFFEDELSETQTTDKNV